ncbi:hypothetical protein [Paenibacillus sp. MSJ-34]|uniref:hypothetical protein n=1 Tax=Paenibacillus sp. MSJ-34 TaxID=2841529 RepID=UPI001C0FB9DA|nr:hypothetical protein [Paenibacillus sp. MSJ-34]MBU5441224.1 hypothetical protein [Paenibacillus sp. MSJ-34]
MDLNWALQSATLLGIGIIGYFIKSTLNEIKTQIKENAQHVENLEKKMDQRVDKVEKELDDLRADLPFIYTTREDFIRTMNNVDKKLDKIHDRVIGGSHNG